MSHVLLALCLLGPGALLAFDGPHRNDAEQRYRIKYGRDYPSSEANRIAKNKQKEAEKSAKNDKKGQQEDTDQKNRQSANPVD